MNRYRCPLAKLLPDRPDVEQVKREGWQENQILVVSLEDQRLDTIDREFIRRIGQRLYGEKGGGLKC